MPDLIGKKLLILGGYQTEIEIINEAKRLGVYTIVTDNHTNWSEAPAKLVADEAWDISWSDIDKLFEKCKETNVDGCIAGFSEKRVFYAQRLSNRLGTPFYGDGAKLGSLFDKNKFKDACISCGVTVPKEYRYDDKIDYPVIVKPTDNGGSRGITICYSKSELEEAYEKAKSFSDARKAIIEEYICADEVMLYFTVCDGNVELSAMCDRYMERFFDKITQLPVAYYYPSKHLKYVNKEIKDKFKKLIDYFSIKNGLIAFQSFVRDGDIIPFDPTYRLDGTMSYHIVEEVNGNNILSQLINYSLTGTMQIKHGIQENPIFNKIGFQIPILLKKGIISQISGMDKLLQNDNILHIFQMYKTGDEMYHEADFSQIFCRIFICVENKSQVNEIVNFIYSNLCIFNENGEDMIIGRFDCSRLED